MSIGFIGTYAVGSKAGLAIEGEFLWTLKDRIDRNFMALFQDLPDMEEMMKRKAEERAKVRFLLCNHRICLVVDHCIALHCIALNLFLLELSF